MSSLPDTSEAGRWRLREVVEEALDLPPAERDAYLARACGGDDELRRTAASMLELERPSEGFLPEPAVPRAAPPLAAGTRLGSYRVLELLGTGGMGEVYLGERADDAYQQRVAIKVIRDRGLAGGELWQRFEAERRLLARMKHPGIAHLLDGGATPDGRPYLVMEHVEGEPIDRYCQREGLGVAARLRLFLKVCRAVEHAHRHLVVHRDLKPANVLVTEDGTVKLLDFGVAKDLGGGTTPETRLMVPATPGYASPEQLTGGPVTTAADVYALGVVLYELLAGRSPFGDGDDPLAGRTRESPPSPPSARLAGGRESRRRRRRLAGDLDHVVLKALAPDPKARYPSVEALARELERHLEGLPLETRGGRLYRARKLGRRHWKALAAAALTLVLAGLLVVESRDRQQAEKEAWRFDRLTDELSAYLMDVFGQADPARSGERSEALDAMLDRGAELLASDAFAREPLMRAALLGAVAQVYRRQGRPAKAEPLLRESLALRRQVLPEHEVVALSAINLAATLHDLDQPREARALLQEARRLLRRHHPGDHPDLARTLNNLAAVEKDLGRPEAAVDLYHQALAMKRRLPATFGPAAQATARKNLAVALRAAGHLDQAEAALRQAAVELQALDPPPPLPLASVHHHLGSLLHERGDLESARELLEGAYAARLRSLGEGHSKTLKTAQELARLDSNTASRGIIEASAASSEPEFR